MQQMRFQNYNTLQNLISNMQFTINEKQDDIIKMRFIINGKFNIVAKITCKTCDIYRKVKSHI